MRLLSTLNNNDRKQLAETDALLFDLDGTLLDSAADLVATLNIMLSEDGCEPVHDPHVFSLVSLGGRSLIDHGYGLAGQTIPTEAMEAIYYPRFLNNYSHIMTQKSTLYPGTRELLACLKAQNHPAILATNKPEGLAKDLIHHFKLEDYFAFIAGGDTFAFRKPDPRHLTEALQKLTGIQPKQPLMIGDSAPDVEAARGATMPSVLVSFGYSPVPLEDLNADFLIHHLDELTQLFQ